MNISWVEDANKPTFSEEIVDGEKKVVSLFHFIDKDGNPLVRTTVFAEASIVCLCELSFKVNGKWHEISTIDKTIFVD